MRTAFQRRDFLKASVGGALVLSLPLSAFAKSGAQLTATPLGDSMRFITGAGGNVVAAKSGDSVVMVDGGSPEMSSALLKLVRKEFGSKRVDAIFNTHWHHEHTGSNLALGKAGSKIISQENTRLWLTTDIKRPWEDKIFAAYPKVAQPNDTFYLNGEMPFGDETLSYGYLLQAHTDGDMYVFFPKENVLVAGGVVSGAGWPFIDYWTGGWIGGLVDGLNTLMGVANDETKVVPGKGPILARADLKKQHEMFSTIFLRLVDLLNSGRGPDEAVAALPTKEFDAEWGDPKVFVTQAFESMWGHYSPDA